MTASKIEWTDRSDWNPLRGCTRVSEGCRNCYAETIAGRFSAPGQPFHTFATRTSHGPRWTGKVKLLEDRLTLPLRWRKPAPDRNKVFVSSTSDLFHENLSDADIDRVFAVMALAPHWNFQVLTKRSARMRAYFQSRNSGGTSAIVAATALDNANWLERALAVKSEPQFQNLWPLPNVWLGVSVEDQTRADERIPDLLDTPAAVRFISAEPLLGAVDLTAWMRGEPFEAYCSTYTDSAGHRRSDLSGKLVDGIDWVIAGGESGPGARGSCAEVEANMRSLLDQCRAAGVAFFGKQNFRKLPLPDDLLVQEFPA